MPRVQDTFCVDVTVSAAAWLSELYLNMRAGSAAGPALTCLPETLTALWVKGLHLCILSTTVILKDNHSRILSLISTGFNGVFIFMFCCWSFACMYVHVPRVCLVLIIKTQRGHQIPWH